MNILATIWSALFSKYAAVAQQVFISAPTAFVMGIISLAEDEANILSSATHTLLDAMLAGKSWDDALTAAYNTFYNGELTEGHKLSMGFLEWLAKTLDSFSGAGAAKTA